MTNQTYIHYYDLIGQYKIDAALQHLQQDFPAFTKELVLIQSRFTANEKKKNIGTIHEEHYQVESNNIIGSLLAFVDKLAKGDPENASIYLQEKEETTPATELISNQMEHVRLTIKENKVFRITVGVLFMVAIAFSSIVAFRHYAFLTDELKIIGLLAANILLYVSIGLLALYALSLIIRGSLFNLSTLNFYKRILKK